MKKIYRVFIDVKASNKENALNDFENRITDDRGHIIPSYFRIQEDPLSDEEEVTVMELARVTLKGHFGKLNGLEEVDNLDLSDKELKKLQKKIEKVMNRS